MLDLRVRNGTTWGLVAAGVVAFSLCASAQEFLATGAAATFQTSTPQIQSGAQINEYLSQSGMTVIAPPPLYAIDYGPTAGMFPLVQSQPLIQSQPTIQPSPVYQVETQPA